MSIQELEKLSNIQKPNSISIYIPTHRSGKEVNNYEDGKLLKTHTQNIKNNLTAKGWNENDALQYLQPIYDLIDDKGFWRHQLDGLAIFLSEDFFKYYRMPFSFDEFELLSDSFYLKPLLPVFSNDEYYYILALSLDKVRVLEANKFYAHELDLNELFPDGIEEILKFYEDFEQSLQMRSQQTGANEGSQVQYHGQGSAKKDNTPYIKEYFRKINEGLNRIMPSNPKPTVLAGVDYLLPIYKEVNTVAQIVDKGITGNPNDLKTEELFEKSRSIIEPYFNELKEKRKNKYQQLAGTGKASYDIEEIVKASFNGRIEAIFVTKEAHVWGKFTNGDQQKVEMHQQFQDHDSCLVDFSAIKTLLNGGEAFLVDPQHIPEKNVDTGIAAVFRY
ncbi:MAG: hypothetical protein ACNS62_08490 [Candidatus Cyclobacteriaceae bacterium M3_2C_046]